MQHPDLAVIREAASVKVPSQTPTGTICIEIFRMTLAQLKDKKGFCINMHDLQRCCKIIVGPQVFYRHSKGKH